VHRYGRGSGLEMLLKLASIDSRRGTASVGASSSQTWNGYAYVANSPLNAVDPLGLILAGGPGLAAFRDPGRGLHFKLPTSRTPRDVGHPARLEPRETWGTRLHEWSKW
jgi:hypothetical protein